MRYELPELGIAYVTLDSPAPPRFGTVDDIAAAAGFLVSDRARRITEQTLNVDGGHSI